MSLSPSPSTLAQSSDLAVETEASTAAIITPPSQSTDVAPARELEPSSADVNPNDGKLTHLIIDAAAIIKGAGMILASASENFWTVPEVVAEIRDTKARHHLQTLPFELKLREPSDEAIKFAAGFARQTGDLRALSRVDLKVIALTYMLERQETGGEHLRTTAVQPGTKVHTTNKAVSRSTLAPGNRREEAPSNAQTEARALVETSLDDSTSNTVQVPEGSQAGATTKAETTLNYGNTADSANAPLGSDAEASVETEIALSNDDRIVTTVSDGTIGKDAASSAIGKEKTKEAKDDTEIQLLCTQIKRAWTTELANEAAQDGSAAEVVTNEDPESIKDSGSTGDGERNPSEQGESEAEAGKVAEDSCVEQAREKEGEDEECSDEDEWEPSNPDVDAEDTTQVSAEVKTGSSEPFTAEDFPCLAENSSTDPTASSSQVAARVASWSTMARSNPAPFKATVKPDPASIPMGIVADERPPVEVSTHRGTPAPRSDVANPSASRILSNAASFGVSGGGADQDDGKGWVNPSNIAAHKRMGLELSEYGQKQQTGSAPRANKCRAGCVTTDFAIQNVLLQVGLPLVSLEGMTVRRVKQWILRCSACFKTCTEMGKLFCPVCGNATLSRVPCSVDSKTGETRVYLRKNYKHNLRGTKYSIPAPNPTKGRFEGDILLREDQLMSGIWAQKARQKQKDISSMFGQDITGNLGLAVNKSADIVVGHGRKNPNAARGRERRGKKKVKKRL